MRADGEAEPLADGERIGENRPAGADPGHTFCSCLHTASSHGDDGCRVPTRVGGEMERCRCRRGRARVEAGPDHLGQALALAADRSARRW